jgi:hypothetical protein
MPDNQREIAQICLNGHVNNKYVVSSPESNQKFCQKCGEKTIVACPGCNEPIASGEVNAIGYILDLAAPAFCANCGQPYPWTQAKREAARQLADALGMSEDDRAILDASIDDMIKDTPSTPVATIRFNILMVKLGKEGASRFREILADVISETAKISLWP